MKRKNRGIFIIACILVFAGVFYLLQQVNATKIHASDIQTEDNETQEDEIQEDAFCQRTVVRMLEDGTFFVSGEGIDRKVIPSANTVVFTGAASSLTKARFTLTEAFDFGKNTADYLLVQGLSERKKKMQLAFYLDDDTKPFATVALKKQKKENQWSAGQQLCENLNAMQLTGRHTISFSVVTKEQGTVSFALSALSFMHNDIPMLELSIDETEGSIDAMNGDSRHDTECYGSTILNIPAGYQSEYSDVSYASYTREEYPLDYVRGRGNSTWLVEKKPYKIKLEQKADLLGMGANKHWILLANYYDLSMLRNKITYWLGRELGMEYTPKCEFVDVMMNGVYLGSYYLSEQVRIGKNRVNIDDLEKDEVSKNATELPMISGGYLLAMSPYSEDESNTFNTVQGNTFMIERPSFEEYQNKAQYEYIKDYMQKTEDAIYGDDFKDSNGVSYTAYMDVDSAIDYYLMQEISMNGDAFCSASTYLYKKRNGKLYWGPLWDFDFVAWGATEYTENYVEGFIQTNNTWFSRLLSDPVFCEKLRKRWPVFKEKLLEAAKDGGQIDKYSDRQWASQRHNYDYWEKFSDIYTEQFEEESGIGDSQMITYDSEVSRFKSWIMDRVSWIDDNLDTLEKKRYTVTFKIEDTNYATLSTLSTDPLGELPVEPQKTGYTFEGWYVTVEEDGGKYSYEITGESFLSEDTVAVARWSKSSDTKRAVQEIGFLKSEYYMMQEDSIYIPCAVMPDTARSTGLVWSSSNPDIVTAEDNMLTAKMELGDATITVTAPNGVKASVKVHVVSGEELSVLESMHFEKKKVRIKAGEYQKLKLCLEPENILLYAGFRFASSNESVVKINDVGYITALKPGRATVIAVRQYDEMVSMAVCDVEVTGDTAQSTVQKGTTFTVGKLQYQVTATGRTKKVCCKKMSKKAGTSIIIPDTVKYKGVVYQVTAIGKNAFAGMTKIRRVIVGKNVTQIGAKAFERCKGLKTLIFRGTKVKKIGKHAFYHSDKKLTVKAPKVIKKKYIKLIR